MIVVGCVMGLDNAYVHAADPIAASADDEVVLPLVNQTLEREPTGVEIQWSNPATGNRGIIVVLQTLSTLPDRPCRKYRRTRVRPEANVEVIEGVGCRIGTGKWDLEETTGPKSTIKKNEGPDVGEKKVEPPPPVVQRCPLLDPEKVVHVPCRQPAPFVAFTLPAKASF